MDVRDYWTIIRPDMSCHNASKENGFGYECACRRMKGMAPCQRQPGRHSYRNGWTRTTRAGSGIERTPEISYLNPLLYQDMEREQVFNIAVFPLSVARTGLY